jgi:hypothetical protein
MPQPMCDMDLVGLNSNLPVNRDKRRFENPICVSPWRSASTAQAFIDILTEGEGDVGGVMQPGPAGLRGMPPYMLQIARPPTSLAILSTAILRSAAPEGCAIEFGCRDASKR